MKVLYEAQQQQELISPNISKSEWDIFPDESKSFSRTKDEGDETDLEHGKPTNKGIKSDNSAVHEHSLEETINCQENMIEKKGKKIKEDEVTNLEKYLQILTAELQELKLDKKQCLEVKEEEITTLKKIFKTSP